MWDRVAVERASAIRGGGVPNCRERPFEKLQNRTRGIEIFVIVLQFESDLKFILWKRESISFPLMEYMRTKRQTQVTHKAGNIAPEQGLRRMTNYHHIVSASGIE